MQHFILNGKILELEKNKDTALAIPVMFPAGSVEFTLEIPSAQYSEGTTIQLAIQRSGDSSGLKNILVEMPAEITRFHLQDLIEIESKDYLLYSCKANKTVRLSLSIVSLN